MCLSVSKWALNFGIFPIPGLSFILHSLDLVTLYTAVYIANLYNPREKHTLTGRKTIKPSWPSIHLFHYSFKGKQTLPPNALCAATCMWRTRISKLCARLFFTPTEKLLHSFPDSNQI